MSVWVYRKSTNTDQYIDYSSHYQASSKESVVSSCLVGNIPLSPKKNPLENARIKQLLRKNGYQEDIIGKIFTRITNNHSLFQS